MKKTLVLIVALLAVLLLATTASAAGKLTVSQESFVVNQGYSSYYAYIFAEVTNTGDKAVEYANCLYEIYDEEGEAIKSDTYGSCYPEVLQPGETGYFINYVHTDDLNTVPADYSLTITGKAAKESSWHYLPTTTDVLAEETSWGDVRLYAFATITNDGAEAALDPKVVYIVRREDGTLATVIEDTLYNIGLVPANSVQAYTRLDYDTATSVLLDAGESLTLEAITVYEAD